MPRRRLLKLAMCFLSLFAHIYVGAFRRAGWQSACVRSGVVVQRRNLTLAAPAPAQVKKSFVGKFNKVKDEHKKHVHEEYKKSASRKSLHGKKNKLADELTSSGHKASPPPEDEAVKFMALLPWILPVVCLTILVTVGIGARMCQAGNYKHTEALREGGVQPSFKYGGPIGRSM